jgi:Tol biopolymer transport system component/predicted Ser/Thr protein kinase
MALTSGTKLGPYEIVSPLGAGGMGEVYRARDTRLDREVAIKVLPSHLCENPGFRARFEREAKTISGLQHPNICVLYDVGRQDGVEFLVMEYLDGETLAARLARKPLPPAETLRIAIEVAAALDKAHRSGIVHRDLKPGNVMLTKGGTTKLLDFGLAKLQSLASGAESAAPAFSAVATVASMASPVTMAGTVVGTMQYMSPEQIQGKEADARSDIFAFGAMLYEMLTGTRAFQGNSQLSVASAVLEKDPQLISAVRPLTPPALEHLVRICLAKDPDQRFQNAHDLKLQLQWITVGGQAGAPAMVVAQKKNRQKILAAATALGWLLAGAAVIMTAVYEKRLNSAEQLLRVQIEPPAGIDFDYVLSGAPALSPDGQQLAFVGLKDGKSIIFVQRLRSGKAEPLAGTETGIFPFWSPDGRYLGFFSNGKLRKIEAAGGPVQALCDAPDGRGGTWNEQGAIVFAPRINGPLQRVSDGGGTPEEATPGHKDDSQFTNRNPYFLPDGKRFLFIQRTGKDAAGSVYAGSLDAGETKQILPVGSNVAYSNGYLFYVKDGTLTAQRFDAAATRFQGNSIPIAESIDYYNPRNLAYFSVSQNVMVYRQAAVENRELVWLDASGKELDHWGEPAPYDGGTFTPASHMAILSRANLDGRGNSLWLADTERKTISRITPDSDFDEKGVVSADGKSLLTTSTTGYNSVIVERPLISSGKEEKLAELGGYVYASSQSRDGRYAFFSIQDAKTSFDIYYMDLAGDRKLVPVLNTPYAERDPKLSPDNRWLAYTSDENGALELYITPFPRGGSKWQVSNGGVLRTDANSNAEDWGPGGKSLYYRYEDKIYVVEVHTDGSKPEFSTPKELMTIPQGVDFVSTLPDGKRSLAIRSVRQRSSSPQNLVLNWQHLVR